MKPPSPSDIRKAVHGIGMDILWNRPIQESFTVVNVIGVCCDSNSDRMKEKLTVRKRPDKARFDACLSKLCLFKCQLVYSLDLEKRAK